MGLSSHTPAVRPWTLQLKQLWPWALEDTLHNMVAAGERRQQGAQALTLQCLRSKPSSPTLFLGDLEQSLKLSSVFMSVSSSVYLINFL